MKRTMLHAVALWIMAVLLGCGGGGNTTADPASTQVSLSVSSGSLMLDAAGDTQTFQIIAGSSWSVISVADWAIVSAASGTGNTKISVTAQANLSGAERSTDVRISSGTGSSEANVTVAVSQAAKNTTVVFALDPDASNIRNLTSTELTALMGSGINIGNTLDAIGGETAWGNPEISEALVDAISNAGFKSIRLPVAWSRFSDADNFVIETTWLERVEQVANYALDRDLYVIINLHWDGGWIQPTYAQQDYVNNRLAVMWEQIASHFRDYDDHLLFAGTNEVLVEGEFGTPSEENYTVQNGFNQTFVNTVRATGGRNAYRHLVIQGYNTNINHAEAFATIPSDVVDKRLLMEVHFYDPFDFTLNSDSNITQWGATATDETRTQNWANEAYIDAQFQIMQEHFYDQGVGVILGEFGAISRTDVPDHEPYRIAWDAYVAASAKAHNLVPFYWDNGDTANHGLGIFYRNTALQAYPDIIDAVTP